MQPKLALKVGNERFMLGIFYLLNGKPSISIGLNEFTLRVGLMPDIASPQNDL